MEKSAHVRADIRNFLPSARSVIVMGTVYNTESGHRGIEGIRDQRARRRDQGRAICARAGLSQGHRGSAARADRVDGRRSPVPFEAAHFVDKHQVQERVFAHHAGIGWIGKNSCVINPELGLVDVPVGHRHQPRCSSPTRRRSINAARARCASTPVRPARIVDARELDATRCISYLTIETEGEIPESAARARSAITPGAATSARTSARGISPRRSPPIRCGRARRATADRRRRCGSSRTIELHAMIKGSAMTYVPLSRLRRNLADGHRQSGDRVARRGCSIGPAEA